MNQVALMEIRKYYGVSMLDAERILRERGEVKLIETSSGTIAAVITIGVLVITVLLTAGWAYFKQRVIGYKVR
jgi:hypothetical protein